MFIAPLLHGVYGAYLLEDFIIVRVLKELNYINWSEITKRAIEEQIAIEEMKKLREQAVKVMDEIGNRVLWGYGPTDYDSAEVIRLWRGLRR